MVLNSPRLINKKELIHHEGTALVANVPTGSTSVPVDVPNSVAPAGVSNKGKTLMVEEDITVKQRTFKQMKDDRLHDKDAKRLHDEEQAQVDRQRAELQRKRQQEVLALAMYYAEANWINIMAQVEANTSLSKTLLGDDVSEDNFPAKMATLIKRKKQALAKKLSKERKDRPMTQGQQRTYMRQFVKNQSCAVYSTGWNLGLVRRFLPRNFLLVPEDLGEETTSDLGTSGTDGMGASVDFCLLEEDAAFSRDIPLICAYFLSILVKTQSSRYVVPTGRVVVHTGRYVVPVGNVIIVSPGRIQIVIPG
nr:JmjC domain-containing protein [Tanacetum cinerariifolium]